MAIEGIGVVGAFGAGVTAFRDALRCPMVAPSAVPVRAGSETVTLPVYRADTTGLEEFFGKRELRRIDHYSKMALFAASLAKKDAGLHESGGSTALIVATGYGPHRTTFAFLDSFLAGGDTLSSPTQFASSVHNAAAGYLSILLNENGPCLTVSQFDMSIPSALATAWCWLSEGRVDTVLLGGLDEYSDILGYCWYRLFGTGSDMQPLQFERQSAVPGEGSVFFVLSRKLERARYGCITGFDSGFITTPSFSIPETGSLLIAADGHRDTGSRYARCIPPGRSVRCHSAIYGSIPTGTAFDIAAAGIDVQLGSSIGPSEPIYCIRLGRQDDFSIVKVEGVRSETKPVQRRLHDGQTE